MARLDDHLLLSLIDRIYAAAIDASLWTDVAKAFGTAFRARFSLVFGFEPATSRVLYAQSWGLPNDVLMRYERTYAALDVRMPAALKAAAGTVVTDETLIDRSLYRASPIYNEFLRPLELDHLMGVLPENSVGTKVIISVNRSAALGPFEPREQAFLGRLAPHLQRAVLLSAKLVKAEAADGLSQELMARLQFGVFLLGSGGRIIDANPVATELLRMGDSLIPSAGCLRAVHRLGNEQLEHAIADTERLVRQRSTVAAKPVLIQRPNQSPLRVVIVPLAQTNLPPGVIFPLMAAFVFCKSAVPTFDPATLSLLYRLTPAEARVAAKLVEGYPLSAIAEAFSISIETARTHLKRTLAKTQCESQSALIRELLLGPAQSMSGGNTSS
jgi:DNA-binding CsgD family transcriptional regulator/PAS domain-containing protein